MKLDWSGIRKNHLLDAALLLILFFMGSRILTDLESHLDIALSDESIYMLRGINLGKVRIAPEDSPLYSVWYWILHRIEPNGVSLYYLNWKITAILPAILFYINLRVHKTGYFLSLLFSVFLLFSGLNISIWPRISNLCICVILLSLIIFKITKGYYHKFFALSIFSLIISFIRPEFFISFIISILIAFYIAFSKSKRLLDYISSKLTYLILGTTILRYVYGLPMFDGSSNRLIIAFGQHYVVNKFLRESIWGVDPWLNWEKYFYSDFGEVHSLADILSANFKAFLNHLEFNAYWFSVLNHIPLKNLVIPEWFFRSDLKSGASIVLIAIFFISYYLISNRRTRWLNAGSGIIGNLPYLIFLIPCLLSNIIIFPRDHYFFIVNIIIICFFILKIQLVLTFIYSKIKYSDRLSFALLFLIIGYVSCLKFNSADYFQSKSFPVRDAVRILNSYQGKINLLTGDLELSGFLNQNFTCISPDRKNLDFAQFIEINAINMIWVSERLLSMMPNKAGNGWIDFLNNYESRGFKKRLISGMDGYLLVKGG